MSLRGLIPSGAKKLSLIQSVLTDSDFNPARKRICIRGLATEVKMLEREANYLHRVSSL